MADTTEPWIEAAAGAGRFQFARGRSLIASVASSALPIAATALAASWLGFYFITGLPYLDLEAFRATITLHAVTGVVVIPYLLSLVVSRRLPGGSPLDVPVVALLGVYLLTTATSLDWRVSIEVTLTAFMAIAVFYVLSDGRLLRRSHVEVALMAALLAAALRALWIVGGDYLDWLQLTQAVRGSITPGDLLPPEVLKLHDVGDHPNILGGMLAMAVPFFLVALVRPIAQALRALAALALLAVLLALFLSLARSAWVAAAAGALTSTLLFTFAAPAGRGFLRSLWPSGKRSRWLLAAGGLAVLVVAAVAAVYVVQSVEARPIWLFRESASPRIDALGAGAEMIQDYPLVGTGPAIYRLLYPEYSGAFPNHAFHSHNGFLQVAIDMGVPGVLAMLALAGALLWILVRGLRETDGEVRLSLIACAGAVVALATFSLFDAPNISKGPLVAIAAVGAVAVLAYQGRRVSDEPPGPAPGWPRVGRMGQLAARAVVPVALAGLLIMWGRLDGAHFYYSSGVANANAERWPEAVDKAERAVELDPDYAIYRLQLGVTLGEAYLDTGLPSFLDGAIAQLERAVELEPRSAIGHANLAMLLVNTGDDERLRESALAAIEFANSDPAVVLAAGTALEASNFGVDAVNAYTLAIRIDANLIDSPFWEGTPFRRAQFRTVLAQSALVFNNCAYLDLGLRAPAGSFTYEEGVLACAGQVAAGQRTLADRLSLADAWTDQGELDDAFAEIDFVLDRQPDNGRAHTSLGRWHAAQGDVESAREQWLLGGQLGEVQALVLLGDSYPAGEAPGEVVDRLRSRLRDQTSQVQFHLIGILYYRLKFFRVSPHTILLPGEWQQAVPARYAEARDALERWTAPRQPERR